MIPLHIDKHCEYIKHLADDHESIEAVASDHFRMGGIYWGLAAMDIAGRVDEMKGEELAQWVQSCCHEEVGGYGAAPGHDPHILHTLSAVQILAILDRTDLLDVDGIVRYIKGLQNADGSFNGDRWREVDTRFTYCAILCLDLLGRLDDIDVPGAVEYVARCCNFDGGFGCRPGGESHSGQVFTCVGALHLAGASDRVDADLLSWWLSERQTGSGGLNGRPEKLQDVCYSWWCLSALAAMDRLDWIDRERLATFILQCQDDENGGISDRPEMMADVYHTFFGLAGLSLMGYEGLKKVDPLRALTTECVARLRRTMGSKP
ncbi:unnamed protein product [Pedinophyceae sp. YPF-701]|nr:unnamed protein product [Pedinophyceae sp. YPF-701]